jgi:hypothetical protein
MLAVAVCGNRTNILPNLCVPHQQNILRDFDLERHILRKYNTLTLLIA